MATQQISSTRTAASTRSTPDTRTASRPARLRTRPARTQPGSAGSASPASPALRTLADALASATARARLEAVLAEQEQCLRALERRVGGRLEAVTDDDREQACQAFNRLAAVLHDVCGRHGSLPVEERARLGAEYGQRARGAILTAGVARRMLVKPRGYAGDAQTIDLMYRNAPFGSGVAGVLTDHAVLASGPSQAVRNRRGLLADTIAETMDRCGARPARVLSIACGPAREISDACRRLDSDRLEIELVDLDEQALSATAKRLEVEGLGDRFRIHKANALRLRRLDLAPQDLVYSIGLIDYFEDRAVIKLLDQIHDVLAPGGKVVLGNFIDTNPVKELMDHVLDWKLIHRSEADMDRLFRASRFGRGCTAIRTEAEGINLFAECIKAG